MIIILGGGMAGLSAAYALSVKGNHKDIHLFEKERYLCTFASARNAAIFRTQEGDPYLSLIVKESAVKLKEIEKEVGHILVSGDGLLINPIETDYYEEEFLEIFPNADFIKSHKSSYQMRDGSLFEGIFLPGNGLLDIAALQQYMTSKIIENGVEIHYFSEIISLGSSYSSLRDSHSLKKITYSLKNTIHELEFNENDVLINSGGSWAKDIMDKNSLWAPPFIPHKRHLYFLKDDHKLENMPILWDERSEFYIRKEGAGYLATHGDETPTIANDYSLDEEEVSLFIQNLANVFPFATQMKMAKSWACLRTFALDGRPVIGYDPYIKNLFWNAGWGGRGMSMSLGVSSTIKETFEKGTVTNETEIDNPFSAWRFI